MIAVRRAEARYRVKHDGITSLHCFSAGPHYDPDNLSFGPVLAVDEHLLAPGAGFAEHPHRGVVIASWVIEGTLRHVSDGARRLVEPGELFVQDATTGLRHSETNASATRPLHLVQTTWLAGRGARLSVVRAGATVPGPLHLFVVAGRLDTGLGVLVAGDSLRADQPVTLERAADNAGLALALTWEISPKDTPASE